MTALLAAVMLSGCQSAGNGSTDTAATATQGSGATYIKATSKNGLITQSAGMAYCSFQIINPTIQENTLRFGVYYYGVETSAFTDCAYDKTVKVSLTEDYSSVIPVTAVLTASGVCRDKNLPNMKYFVSYTLDLSQSDKKQPETVYVRQSWTCGGKNFYTDTKLTFTWGEPAAVPASTILYTEKEGADFVVSSAKDGKVVLRTEPNASAASAVEIPSGTSVTITKISNGWYYTPYGGKGGWINPDTSFS